MAALVSVETVLLVVLVVLVAGLLRSHAEILRRLGPETGERTPPERAAPVRRAGETAPTLVGATAGGDPVRLDFAGGDGAPTLLAFLGTGCTSCQPFWAALGQGGLPPAVQTVIVTRGSDRESPARVRALAPAGSAVVMSPTAYADYGVSGTPYFVLVERTIVGEGMAST